MHDEIDIMDFEPVASPLSDPLAQLIAAEEGDGNSEIEFDATHLELSPYAQQWVIKHYGFGHSEDDSVERKLSALINRAAERIIVRFRTNKTAFTDAVEQLQKIGVEYDDAIDMLLE